MDLAMATNFIFNCATLRELDQIEKPKSLWDCHCANRRWVSAKSTTRNQTSQLWPVGFAPYTILEHVSESMTSRRGIKGGPYAGKGRLGRL